ncbi:MAG: beta-ketoacyl synthase chain length factor [Gammaproteobacteria bacterium]
MNKIADFVLKDWGVWAPGLHGEGDWQAWRNGHRLMTQEMPKIPDFIPKLQQRRLSPLARAVFNAIDQCVSPDEKLPTVFSSAHGEVGKALGMLKAIQAGEELSPTAFSLSVHNAIAGLYSIAYHNPQEITVLAPGTQGIAPAFFEALGLLQEYAEQVLVVLYDEPIDDFFPVAPYKLNADFTCALALRLSLTGPGMPLRFCRGHDARDDGDDGEQPLQLPHFIDFLLQGRQGVSVGCQGHHWRWEKI